MSKQKPYWEMTTEELAAATAHFDKEFVIYESRPLTPEERREWERAKRKKPSKPKPARETVTARIDPAVLRRLTALAKKRKLSRSRLINDVLAAAVARNGN